MSYKLGGQDAHPTILDNLFVGNALDDLKFAQWNIDQRSPSH
ncbi:hypothetical protein [Scytonema sp. PCC 10023]